MFTFITITIALTYIFLFVEKGEVEIPKKIAQMKENTGCYLFNL